MHRTRPVARQCTKSLLRTHAGPTIFGRSSTTTQSQTMNPPSHDLPQADPPLNPSDPSTLLTHISRLESQLQNITSQLRLALASSPPTTSSSSTPTPTHPKPKRKPAKPFNPSRFTTRLIALKLSYTGAPFNGYEHANNTLTPKPTVEEVLWKALRRTRLIFPEVREGCDAGFEVVWGEKERGRRYTPGNGGTAGNGGGVAGSAGESEERVKLDVTWEGCEYSKCGRTDKGVSAFGQVIGIRVRSNRPKPKTKHEEGEQEQAVNGDGEDSSADSGHDVDNPISDLPSSPDIAPSEPSFSDANELPYVSLLNAVLPSSIRVLAWCPNPPPDFDARFSCRQRQYKYFFTNPAFLPTPGPFGMTYADGRPSQTREGWLDIDRMREAASKLVGTKDYRNLCKIDASKQMSSCVRKIEYAGIEEWSASGAEFSRSRHLNSDGTEGVRSLARKVGIGDFIDEEPKVYTFTVHGSAFLWHQVRCMVAVLFLVGQGLEEPSIVDELLDVESTNAKPHYEMADDAPLVLWDCVFEIEQEGGKHGLTWIYAGDESSVGALTAKHDGKFGSGGLVDSLWSQWRKAKIDEVLSGSLLDLALAQGDGTAMQRGGFRDPSSASRSQKVFDGSDSGRVSGVYVPLMQRPKIAPLEEQNERYINGAKGRRRLARNLGEVEDDE